MFTAKGIIFLQTDIEGGMLLVAIWLYAGLTKFLLVFTTRSVFILPIRYPINKINLCSYNCGIIRNFDRLPENRNIEIIRLQVGLLAMKLERTPGKGQVHLYLPHGIVWLK